MNLYIKVDVDGTWDQCEEVLEEIDELIEEQALLVLGSDLSLRIIDYKEIPPVGRARKARPSAERGAR